MKASKWVIVSALIGLAMVLVGLNLHKKAAVPPDRETPSGSVQATLSPAAERLPAASSAKRSNPYDPLQLTRPGNRDAVRQAFPTLAEDRLADGRSFIEFDMASAMRLDQGDMFALVLPGETGLVAVRIESLSTFEGMRRWTGRFVGTDTEPNEFSLTLAADGRYAAGNFMHGDQSFVMEAKDGAGWFNAGATENGHLLDEEP